jgi:hypothetical protein
VRTLESAVKRIINGKSYDTDTATLVASGDHGHELSMAGWQLYRTRQGAFFEVVLDHDGGLQDFRPLTDQEAYAFMEVHANNLIEKYFGPIPEAAKAEARYSRRSIIAAVDVLESRYSQAQITSLLTDLGPDIYRKIRNGTNASAKKCMNDLK